ncbi:16S rRNA (cytosine(967)-C(5))-methyltransferase RsmB [Aeromonas caviae]|uniref:16S rRNA (cytosine(967)-C(5))-methyltransferase RsmB n=1 Tax=Aeromonas TaxID=642 RepID=UPI001B33C95A|nr:MULTISPECIES: 16S rRNA (cytosine(967)-C(5))-methyltransferase RsmB [Aeromonas]MBP4067148.1 16S rRNA (cytosine(967)-C(5))-methyltransferase RsmB [Aeromonas sp. MaB10011B]MBP4078605.1 16S rRNA (cytosine(967)-C(5))-methyltransferase RsmB [Aeromonas sp. MrichA-1]
MKTRAQAALVIQQVLDQGQSLSAVLPAAQEKVAPRDRALLQELCYGTLRWLPRLDAAVSEMMDKPLKNKSRIFHYLILVGLYQLIYTRIPAHAAVAETVNAVKLLKGSSLRGLINGVLRNFQRSAEVILLRIDRVPSVRLGHPEWLTKRLRQAYPDDWEFIMEANNQRPPMWIRNNSQRQSREAMLARMSEAGIPAMAGVEGEDCILLEHPCDVTKLPGFEQGDCSVQDGAAQQAAALLDPQPGEWVLDACAAPGGKTAHLLERQPALAGVVAVDADDNRLKRVQENLDRIGLQAQVIHGDASTPELWWPQGQFDRILLDAPCSATGVIRRHPDIKWLRRDQDIRELAELQRRILDALWGKLKQDGTLLYATCSVLPEENREQIRAFLADTPDARLVPLHAEDTPACPGLQFLPGEAEMDGFYYAKLIKL